MAQCANMHHKEILCMICSMSEIGSRIASMRNKHGYTQRELAKVLNTSREVVAKWENGSRTIGIEHLISLAEIFKTSCDEILRDKKPENISFSEKTGLSDKSIEVLATDYKPNYVFVNTINYLIENDNLKCFFTDVIDNVSLALKYQRAVKKKAEQYKGLDDKVTSAIPKEVNDILTIFGELENAGIDDLHPIRRYYLEREAYILSNEIYDFIFDVYKKCSMSLEISGNDE